MRIIKNRDDVLADMAGMEARAILQAEVRFGHPDEAILDPEIAPELKLEMETMLKSANTAKEGFIMWIKQDSICDLLNIEPLWPSTQFSRSTLSNMHSFHSSRQQYVDEIKRYIANSKYSSETAEMFVVAPVRSNDDLRQRMEATTKESQRVRDEMLKKDKEDNKKLTSGAACIAATAASIFQSIFPSHLISITDKEGKLATN